jgi:hypothetical protein
VVIRKRRIHSLERYLGFLPEGTLVALAVLVSEVTADILSKIGFSLELGVGESVLPADVFGPVSRFNAHGKYRVHRDRPMETVTRQIEWHWTEYHGPDAVEQSDIVDVPYQRYPRTFIPPPSVEVCIREDTSGAKIVVGPEMQYSEPNREQLVHVVNLFLEIFGHCEVLSSDLERIIGAPRRLLNWKLLPPGRRPWEKLQEEVDPIVRSAPKGNQPVIRYRLEMVNRHGPEFYAIGQAGFRGYIVFGFPQRSLYVLESIFHDCATYVFGEDWEELSKMTKAEIIAGGLERARLIHRKGWPSRLAQILA